MHIYICQRTILLSQLWYLFNYKLQLAKFLFIILCGVCSRKAYIFCFSTLSNGIDGAQSFLGYVFIDRTLFSHSILFSITCTSVTGGVMMNRRQLQ